MNRLKKCPLKKTKELESDGHGSVDYRSVANSGIIIVKWLDNGPVHLVSNFVDVEPITAVERLSKQHKKWVPIPCPQVVKMYNKGMGVLIWQTCLLHCIILLSKHVDGVSRYFGTVLTYAK